MIFLKGPNLKEKKLSLGGGGRVGEARVCDFFTKNLYKYFVVVVVVFFCIIFFFWRGGVAGWGARVNFLYKESKSK